MWKQKSKIWEIFWYLTLWSAGETNGSTQDCLQKIKDESKKALIKLHLKLHWKNVGSNEVFYRMQKRDSKTINKTNFI